MNQSSQPPPPEPPPDPATDPPTDPPPDTATGADPPATLTQGLRLSLANHAQRDEALEKAVDYRGDVTIETTDGRRIEGYVFDRRNSDDAAFIRVIPSDGSARVTIPYEQISGLVFSGKDTAFGKGWEAWVKKYNELKSKGQEASIESDPLE